MSPLLIKCSSLAQLSNNSNSLLRNVCYFPKLPGAKQALNVLNLSPQSSCACSLTQTHKLKRSHTVCLSVLQPPRALLLVYAYSVHFCLLLSEASHCNLQLQSRHNAASPDQGNFTILLLLSLNQMTRAPICGSSQRSIRGPLAWHLQHHCVIVGSR